MDEARLWGLQEPPHFIENDPRKVAHLLAATEDTAGILAPGPSSFTRSTALHSLSPSIPCLVSTFPGLVQMYLLSSYYVPGPCWALCREWTLLDTTVMSFKIQPDAVSVSGSIPIQ